MIRRSRLVMDLTWAVIAPSLAFAASSRADSFEATFVVIVVEATMPTRLQKKSLARVP